MHIVACFQVAGFERDGRRRLLAARDIAQCVVHAEIANEFGGEQVSVHAVKWFADVGCVADYQKGGQEFADGTCIDIAMLVAGVQRGSVVVMMAPR